MKVTHSSFYLIT